MKKNNSFFKYFIAVVFLGITGLVLFQFIFQRIDQDKLAFQQTCGSCHILPDPASLPKSVWENQVLPEMGARLGIKVSDYDPTRNLSNEEKFYLKSIDLYPNQPKIDQEQWERVKNYIFSLAPDKIQTTKINKPPLEINQFTPVALALDKRPGALTTCINYQENQNAFLIGNAYGEIYRWKNDQDFSIIKTFLSPVTHVIDEGSNLIVTEVGIMHPTDIPSGKIWLNSKALRPTFDLLRRPVFTLKADMNDDGIDEIFICEFGNNFGQLSMFFKNKDAIKYEKKVLLNIPGGLKLVAQDMNNDQKKDLVLLTSQGNERVYILYNYGQLRFTPKPVLLFEPGFGSSWFDVFDYDGDGDLDIAVVNGDNADYSVALKPFHGLRIYINEAKNKFKERFFYPLHGATRVVARDFDQDKDIDFAITAFFPDFEQFPKESFIYLENQQSDKFQFQPYSSELAMEGRWLLMETGDYDNDGDDDIILGSCLKSSAPKHFMTRWNTQNVDLLVFKNNLIKN